ncbi:MarR family winged helix-turn-helix transcriptional regulator [Aureimonas populi]|uniref:MarR family winged helix-turn-helix transcriptional regulator n=1 Tax=Aureimonas populi TaxID=1701758 RepID=A0ABW5CIQ6_9HYPH|nr:MarR family winged helix-turn-helix transcriptional regulator [Aureimonas populi]
MASSSRQRRLASPGQDAQDLGRPAGGGVEGVGDPSPEEAARFSSKAVWPYYWIARVNARYLLRMEELLKQDGLDISRWRVLSSLREHGTLGVSEISEYCILKLNTTTKIVQRMVAEGLVETRSSRSDGRVTEVTLTPQGAQMALRAADAARIVFERSFADFEPSEIAQINGLLKRVFDRLV